VVYYKKRAPYANSLPRAGSMTSFAVTSSYVTIISVGGLCTMLLCMVLPAGGVASRYLLSLQVTSVG